mgnify:CR=1 FL=1
MDELTVEIEAKKINISKIIRSAWQKTIQKEEDILERGRSERLFANKLACNLQNEIDNKLDEDLKIVVDSPYNKHLGETKWLKGKNIEIDIGVHTRDNDNNNILVIELETVNNPKRDDIWKVQNMTDLNNGNEYRYKYGLYLAIGIKSKAGDIIDEQWYINGKLENIKIISCTND